MGSKHSKVPKDPELSTIKTKFTEEELSILYCIFSDLSARDYGIITKETFLRFFGLTGVWGERLFRSFDIKYTGNITFAGFLSGLATYCKCPENEKIDLLFKLYDVDNDGYIEKKDLVTMLYNYPKQYLKGILEEIAPDGGEKMEHLNEEKRTRTMTELDMDIVKLEFNKPIAPRKTTGENFKELKPSDLRAPFAEDFNDLSIADEEKNEIPVHFLPRDINNCLEWKKVSEENHHTDPPLRKKRTGSQALESDPIPKRRSNRLTTLEMQGISPIIGGNEFDKSAASPARRNRGLNSKELSMAAQTEEVDSSLHRGLSHDFSPLRHSVTIKSLTSATKANGRIKGYASHVFNTFDTSRKSGKMKFEEFKDWINQHPMLLKVFDDTFHQDLWNSTHHDARLHSPSELSTTVAMQQSHYSERQFTYKDEEPECKFKIGRINTKIPEATGFLSSQVKKKPSKAEYFELKGPFLIYYMKKEQKFCKGVIFLDGCKVEPVNDNNKKKYGFKITHQSPSYIPQCFNCQGKADFDQWMDHLRHFQNSSIGDYYRIGEKIGTGQFSTVYRGSDFNDSTKEYAIKIIDKEKLKPTEKQSILSETSVMKVLDHPSTIKLIETIEIQNKLYIVMELVKDGDLFDYILSKDFLEEYEASYIMKQLLNSINYIHSMGIIHRDLKPENIMISLNANHAISQIKLIDFGFATFVCSTKVIKDACGTPNYLAPEVLKEAGYDKKVDVFSLGVIMYFMLRGYLPFDDPNVGEILKKTYKAEPPMSDEHWNNISEDSKDLLKKLLCKDPKTRIEIEEALKHPWIQNREALLKYEGVNPKPAAQDRSPK